MTALRRLLTLRGPAPLVRMLVAAGLSAGSALLVLAIINRAAEDIAARGVDQVDWWLAALFGLASVIFLVSESALVAGVGAAMEDGVHRLRLRLLDRLMAADYVHVERFGQAALFESISQNSSLVSDNSHMVAAVVRAAALLVGILLYILYLSPLAFVLVLLTVGVGGVFYARAGQRVYDGFRALMGAESRLFGAVQDLFDGIKEIRLSSRRSAEIGRAFRSIVARVRRLAIDVQGLTNGQFVFGQVAFYGLLAVVVFILPVYGGGHGGDVTQVTTAVLFMIGPIGTALGTMPILASADAAVRAMTALDEELAALAAAGAAEGAGPAASPELPEEFSVLALHDVGFTYPAPADGEAPFAVGPIDLTIRRGEVIFVTGGNGSGKSTFMKLLTGLYAPRHGRITLDGIAVQGAALPVYRERIATVFSDAHLFARLHGVPAVDEAEAAALFRLFEMEHVTRLEGDSFGTTAVSMGQRKRLALIAALLEHKPILVLDEWAADQDPHFRRVFYRKVIPLLRERGLTVIAVTHDDHYFDAADRIIAVSFGRVTEVAPGATAEAPA